MLVVNWYALSSLANRAEGGMGSQVPLSICPWCNAAPPGKVETLGVEACGSGALLQPPPPGSASDGDGAGLEPEPPEAIIGVDEGELTESGTGPDIIGAGPAPPCTGANGTAPPPPPAPGNGSNELIAPPRVSLAKPLGDSKVTVFLSPFACCITCSPIN